MQKPDQQGFETQPLQVKPARSAARTGENLPVIPDPHIAQNQRDGDKQKTQQRIARAGADAGLVHLPIAGFDAKARAVGVGQPAQAEGLKSPVGIHPGKTAVAFPLPAIVAAIHTDRHRGPALPTGGPRQGMLAPTPFFPDLKGANAAGSLPFLGLAAASDGGPWANCPTRRGSPAAAIRHTWARWPTAP